MKINFKTLTLIILTTGLSVYSCKQKAEPVSQIKVNQTPTVRVQPAMESRMVAFIEITGTIEANVSTDISSPSDGIVESLMARENQLVEKDMIIAVINPTDRLALISKNRLQVEQIEERLRAAGENTNEFNQLKTELDKAKNDLAYAEKMYQTVPVICPLSGLVTQRWTDVGSQVSSKEKILTVSDMNSLVIKAEVNEKYFQAIKQGKQFSVILNAYPDDTLKGRISLVYPQVDPVTRTVKFDIRILDFNKKLLPGMMATIKIPVSTSENALSVPEHAVLTSSDSGYFLFVVNKDSLAVKRNVKTGIASGSRIEIIKGLGKNDKVVVSGQELLNDSMKVKIIGTPKGGM
jgi:multidrug efflux pump subunit AcrA (membrane-fusion protein)